MKTFFIRTEENLQSLVKAVGAAWKAAADSGNCLMVEVKRENSRRSTAQNARYWAILNDVAEQAEPDGRRYDRDVWHEFFKRTFLSLEDGPLGLVYVTSTTNLSTAEFAEYTTKVEAYAASELGVVFLEP